MVSVAPLIVITGPTASGKSALALELAEKWGGEIICADSRTVYKGMDIGTAKPSIDEQKRVRHWALDVVEPGERFTVADFQKIANDAISNIRSRNKIPFLVGGTGLYVDAVVLNYVFGPDANSELRNSLENLSVEQLVSLHVEQHLELPINHKNRRHLVRSIEKNNSCTSRNITPSKDVFVIAIKVEKDGLRKKIQSRVQGMFEDNIVSETQHLITMYGSENEAMTGNVYRIVRKLIDGEIGEEAAIQLCATRDWQLAKRQLTWLRRHDFVQWYTLDGARDAIEAILQKHRDA